jgi:serine/threonine-protein kinase RsbW
VTSHSEGTGLPAGGDGNKPRTVRISLALSLPRDAGTIPVARHIARDALREAGVTHDCSSAIEVALTEAATNVVRHSGPGDEYEVAVSLTGEHCTIRVVDTGRGFDFSSLGGPTSEPSAERGRGVQLMNALVDQVTFESKPQEGTIVHLEKRLDLMDASPMRRFSGA